MKYSLSILILIFISSCKTDKMDSLDYQIFTKTSGPLNSRTIDSMCYFSFFEKDKKIYEYRSLEGDSTYFYRFEKNIKNNSILKIINGECKLIDSLILQYRNKEMVVFKYKYDMIGQEDEEGYYYFSNKYGLIMTKSIAWLRTNTLINESEFKSIQDSILRNSEI